MARTKEQIQKEIEINSPEWLRRWSMARSLMRAAARVFAFIETMFEALLLMVFRQTSEGAYLDDIGNEHNIERLPGESDALYRQRITLRSQGVTPNALRAELKLIVDHYLGEGFEVLLFEPYQVFVGAGAFSDDVTTITPPTIDKPKHLFWLSFPLFPRLNNSGTAFADLSFSDCDFAGDDHRVARYRFINTILLEWIEQHRSSGVAFGVTVNDEVQEVHIDLLFSGGPFLAI